VSGTFVVGERTRRDCDVFQKGVPKAVKKKQPGCINSFRVKKDDARRSIPRS
jgi:hypothetical protein